MLNCDMADDLRPSPRLIASLCARYAEPQRAYHTLAHIEACLDLLAEQAELSDQERRLLTYAIWWHDAVYDPLRQDNEEQSAELARADLATLCAPQETIEEVARLILLTKGHAVPAGDRLGALLVSIDLAILGANPADYDVYAHAIRREYGFVPDALYRAGRAKVLRHFLDAETIFPDGLLRQRYEAQARANLARELAALERGEALPG